MHFIPQGSSHKSPLNVVAYNKKLFLPGGVLYTVIVNSSVRPRTFPRSDATRRRIHRPPFYCKILPESITPSHLSINGME